MARIDDSVIAFAVAIVDRDEGFLTLHWEGADGVPALITREGLEAFVDEINETLRRAMSAEATVAILRSDNPDDIMRELLELRELNESYRVVISNLTGIKNEEES